jgi:hypothetical protein
VVSIATGDVLEAYAYELICNILTMLFSSFRMNNVAEMFILTELVAGQYLADCEY